MKVIVSLLRGINVSGQKKVPMKELKTLYEELGFTDVSTCIQSGNVIFCTTEKALDKLPQKVEQKIKAHFGFDVSVIHRTPEQLKAVLQNNPFLDEKDLQENKLYVAFMVEHAGGGPHRKSPNLPNRSRPLCRDGARNLPLPARWLWQQQTAQHFFESKLHVVATTRNWRTVNILYNMALTAQTKKQA